MDEPNVAPGRMTPAEVAHAVMAGTPEGKTSALDAITELLRLYGITTEAPPEDAEPLIPDTVPSLDAVAGSRLDQLSALYAELKPRVDAETKRLKEITDAIKVAAMMDMARVGATDAVDIRTPSLHRPLRLSNYERTTVSGKALEAAHPAIYRAFSKTSVVWTLRAVSG